MCWVCSLGSMHGSRVLLHPKKHPSLSTSRKLQRAFRWWVQCSGWLRFSLQENKLPNLSFVSFFSRGELGSNGMESSIRLDWTGLSPPTARAPRPPPVRPLRPRPPCPSTAAGTPPRRRRRPTPPTAPTPSCAVTLGAPVVGDTKKGTQHHHHRKNIVIVIVKNSDTSDSI